MIFSLLVVVVVVDVVDVVVVDGVDVVVVVVVVVVVDDGVVLFLSLPALEAACTLQELLDQRWPLRQK